MPMKLEAPCNWVTSLGDPTLFGWFTVASYALAAYFCWRTSTVSSGRDRQVWRIFMVVMVTLGLNKQLDLQLLFFQEARRVFMVLADHKERALLRVMFIAITTTIALCAIVVFWRRYGFTNKQVKWGTLGMTILVIFGIVRSLSFNRFGLVYVEETTSETVNFFLENLGVLLIWASATKRHSRINTHIAVLKRGR
jgi:hypothetical protein